MIDVAFAADEKYAPHAATLLSSLLTSNDPEMLRAHFLHPPELSIHVIDRLRGMVESSGASIEFHAISARTVRGLPSMGRISRVMWYRLLLPELLPAIKRVLYLDCDVLVLDRIAPLWDLDLDSCQVAAVSNVFPADLLDRPEQLGLPPHGYFNSGVLLMDLDAWRAKGCAQAIAVLAREHPERLIFPDQDALNIVLGDSRLALHPRWNAQNSVFYSSWAADVLGATAVAEARADPAIVHFEGPAHAKPWHPESPHPYRQAYLDHRAHTPWPKIRSESNPARWWLLPSMRRSSR